MARVRYSPRAEADLDSIGEYTLTSFGPRQYDEYMDGLEAYCQKLVELPVLGRPYRPLPPYQWSRYVSHVVYFRRKDDGDIVVVRILGKKMDPELHLDPAQDDEPDEDEQA